VYVIAKGLRGAQSRQSQRKGFAPEVVDRSPVVSLVVSTKGRQHQLVQLLDSLDRQTFKDFELIIVEQNEKGLVAPLLKKKRTFPIFHIHTPSAQGLSRGRNRGIAEARGEVLLFPDDDCWYPAPFIESGLRIMFERKLDALTGRPTNEKGEPIQGRFESEAQWITPTNVWTTQIEWAAFWRRDLLIALAGYDEVIGVGAQSPWQSAEGQDLMLRALKNGARCWYDPSINAHDAGVDRRRADAATIARARAYGRGMGYVLRKQRLGIGVSSYLFSRAIGGAIVAAITGRRRLAMFHAATALGRLEGILGRCLSRFA
jgi:glycosyltransferase involved in cell wall biosynthesis